MDPQVFEKFRAIIYKESGIVIAPEKLPLLSNRINKRLSQLGIKSEAEYLHIIETQLDGNELVQLIDVVSTNVTHFYRESGHFSVYRDYLASLARTSQRTIKVWCAAASSGEEPYTLGFEAASALENTNVEYRILATDICTKVLNFAVQRTYSDNAAQSIPTDIRTKYLVPHIQNGARVWVVSDEISKQLLFKRMNLVSYPYPVHGPIDVIFCRNVMIYFDTSTRAKIVKEFWRILRPGGLLFLSYSENLLGVDHSYEKISGSIFRKGTNE
jgi:chemotaxis protein methyltransferase CheR